jgi:glycosyltransferase involved in cell wall biosynthesis
VGAPLLFLADFPDGVQAQDGASQRILAIDRLFEEDRRVYLRLSLTRYWIPQVRRSGPRTLVRANAFTGAPLAIYLAARCRIAYLHSVFGALYAGYLLPFVPFVLDLHGVVPEEQALLGHRRRARWLDRVEARCVKYARAVVCVTGEMASHLAAKYPGSRSRRIVLPIVQSFLGTPRPAAGEKQASGRPRVVYSGGMQPWQNVDRMVDAMARTRDRFDFSVFTPVPDAFRARLEAAGVQAEVRSLDLKALFERYRDMHLGFALRDPDLVNRVACPTKLSEYMHFGIVPVVTQPVIGDMARLRYRYVLLRDLEASRLPSGSELEEMRSRNWQVLDELQVAFEAGARELRDVVHPPRRAGGGVG